MNADNLIIALQLAVDQFGKTILSDSKLINILLDLGAFKAMPSTKSVIRELITEGFVSKIVSSTDYSRVTSLVPVMVTQTGFNKDIVEYVVNCISFVIGLLKDEPKLDSASTANNNSQHNVQPTKAQPLNGEYSEKLPTGGDLIISANSWHIRYYFSGPDARYNGTFKTIYAQEIDKYIQAWDNNYKKYQELKKILPKGGDSNYPGEMGMSIRFGFAEGVCLTSYHMSIRDEQGIKKVIKDYEEAKIKASKIQKILKGN